MEKNKLFIFAIILASYFLILNTNSHALDMDSSQYKIKYSNINIGSLHPTSANYSLSNTVGQTAAQEFNSAGYTVKAGFQYWHAIVPFTFSISQTNINLGTLIPETPSTATTDLSVSFGSAGQYQVTAIEETPLKTLSGQTIDNTSCNGLPSDTCDTTTAKTWNSSSKYGFGYKMSGEDVPTTFTSCSDPTNCYRPFPDRSATPTPGTPVIVMSNTNITVDDLTSKPKDATHLATVTFKANISSVQNAGSYQTTINFIATPSF